VPLRRFYRIIEGDRPHVDHFKSYAELGIPLLFDTVQGRQMAREVSVYDTEESARQRALTPSRRGKTLGDHLAVLEIDDSGPIRWRQSGNDPHHIGLHGSPDDLLGAVIEVIPV
jgi:hypothetical protein